VSLRLLLVRHAPTEQTRDAHFGDDAPPTPRGLEQAAALVPRLPRAQRALTSPAEIARATAEALGLAGVEEDPALEDWDFGAWAGRPLDEVLAEEPAAVRAWMTDPEAAPPSGERLVDVLERGADWLEALGRTDTGEDAPAIVAVTHAAVVRACVVAALGAPPSAFWTLDVAPLSITELRHRDKRWRVRSISDPG
jgi:broad specificity phosphatase PhoE